jgi:hypothetical protein
LRNIRAVRESAGGALEKRDCSKVRGGGSGAILRIGQAGLRSASNQEAVAKKRQAPPYELPEVLEILPSSFETAVLGVMLTTNGGDKLHSFDLRKCLEFCDRNPPDHFLLLAIVDEH